MKMPADETAKILCNLMGIMQFNKMLKSNAGLHSNITSQLIKSDNPRDGLYAQVTRTR